MLSFPAGFFYRVASLGRTIIFIASKRDTVAGPKFVRQSICPSHRLADCNRASLVQELFFSSQLVQSNSFDSFHTVSVFKIFSVIVYTVQHT